MNEIRNAHGKEFGEWVCTTWVKDAVDKLRQVMAVFEKKSMFWGDGFSEAVSVLTNWGDFNYRDVPVQSVQLGNPTDSWGCSVQNCIVVMVMGAVGFVLAEHEGNPDEFVIGVIVMGRPKSPLGADLYCTSARSIPRSLVYCAKEFEARIVGEIVHHGRPAIVGG